MKMNFMLIFIPFVKSDLDEIYDRIISNYVNSDEPRNNTVKLVDRN